PQISSVQLSIKKIQKREPHFSLSPEDPHEMIALRLELLFLTALLASVRARSIDTEDKGNLIKGLDDIVTGDMCQECVQIFKLLTDLASDEGFQNPADICAHLQLCGDPKDGRTKDLLFNNTPIPETMAPLKMETSIQCSVCTYILGALGFLLPKERTQPQCNKVVAKYVQILLDMLNKTSPDFICSLIRLCDTWKNANKALELSDCDSCLTLAFLTQLHLGTNATEHQATSFLDNICQLHPSDIMPKCEVYVQLLGKYLGRFLSKQQGLLDACWSANLCISGEQGLQSWTQIQLQRPRLLLNGR
ncbi:hypothetical protein DNTS_003622, partial [Danionella cerebrum]